MGINLKEHGWGKAPATDNKIVAKLPAGGYVCKIFDARLETVEGKGLRLICDVDIDEGDFKGYFSARRKGPFYWDFNAQFVRYVLREDGKTNPAFEGFIKLLEKDNKNFHFDENDFEPDQLRALKCGFTFGEREYLDINKNLRTKVNIRFPESIQNIREGKFKTPPLQKLSAERRADLKAAEAQRELEKAKEFFDADAVPVDEDDLPF